MIGREWFGRHWARAKRFFSHDLWFCRLPPFFSRRGLALRFLRFCHLLIKGFQENEIRLHAVSLTFNTLLALVPLLALSLAILKGLNIDFTETLNEDALGVVAQMEGMMEQMPEEMKLTIEKIQEEAGQVNFAKIGGVGALILLVMMVQVLSRMESSFNHVWGITRSRNWLRKATNYISIVVVIPLLLITAISLSAKLKWPGAEPGLNPDSAYTAGTNDDAGSVPEQGSRGSSARRSGGQFLPFFATWIAFFFLYLAVPYTHVKVWAALVGGFTGALGWHMWFRFYIYVQPGITSYNAIYGTLSAIPIFLIWLYFNWVLILAGAKITHAVQTGSNYQPEGPAYQPSIRTRFLLTLAVLSECAHSLEEGAAGFKKQKFADRYQVPLNLLSGTLDFLVAEGFIVETAAEDEGYLLAQAPRRLPIKKIFQAIIERGQPPGELGIDPLDERVQGIVAALLTRLDEDSATLVDLLDEENHLNSPKPTVPSEQGV